MKMRPKAKVFGLMTVAVAAALLWCLPALAAGQGQGGVEFQRGSADKRDCVKVTVNGEQRCMKNKFRPEAKVPNRSKPEFVDPATDDKCPAGFGLVTLHGKKRCVQCNEGYSYHDYYGQGACVSCDQGWALREWGGKIMCISCPGNSRFDGRDCRCPRGTALGQGPDGPSCYPLPAQ